MLGACDGSDFDGDTILERSDDVGNNEDVFISEIEIINFTTEDKLLGFLFFMGNNMITTAITLGEKDTKYISDHYDFIGNERIEEGTLLNSTKR